MYVAHSLAVVLAIVLWSDMQESAFAILSHTVPIEVMCDTECTATVLYTVVRTSCFPHVLIMCAKCDAHNDGPVKWALPQSGAVVM